MNWGKRTFICSFTHSLFVEFLLCPGTDQCREDTVIGSLPWKGLEFSGGDTNRSRSLKFAVYYGWDKNAVSVGSKATGLERHYPVSSFSICHLGWKFDKDTDVVSFKSTFFHFLGHARHCYISIISMCTEYSMVMLHLCRNRDSHSQ